MNRFLYSAVLLFISSNLFAGTWMKLDAPNAQDTSIDGIKNGKIYGSYDSHGFVYDGVNWTNFDFIPNAGNVSVTGMDGAKTVGIYRSGFPSRTHGFIYDGMQLTTIDAPDGTSTYIMDIQGNKVTGTCMINGTHNSYIYDGENWTFFNKPNETKTYAKAIVGNNIVGEYVDSSGEHGFIYDGINWTTIDKPGALSTQIFGADGSNLVGRFDDELGSHGFIYDGLNWITLDAPWAFHSDFGPSGTTAYGIEGNKIVGSYFDENSNIRGFVYEIPEPASALLFALGAGLLRFRFMIQSAVISAG